MVGKIFVCVRLYKSSHGMAVETTLLKYGAVYSARNLQTSEETRSSHVSSGTSADLRISDRKASQYRRRYCLIWSCRRRFS